VRLGTSIRALDARGAGLALATIAVTRGDAAVDVTALDDSTSAPGVESIARGDFVETLQPVADGIEQSWQFDRAPGSAGDLTVAVDASGLDYVSTTGDGLQLRLPGAFDVGYSHGVWVDASGHRTAIPARFDHGRILLTVPAAVLASSAFPAVLDPVIIVTPIIT
jgi:hypothetical protein